MLMVGIALPDCPSGTQPHIGVVIIVQTTMCHRGRRNVHKIVDFCFHFGYSLFKSHRYDITKKGGGSREPLPFLRQSRSQILFSTSLLSNPFRKEIPLPQAAGFHFAYRRDKMASISSRGARMLPWKKPGFPPPRAPSFSPMDLTSAVRDTMQML